MNKNKFDIRVEEREKVVTAPYDYTPNTVTAIDNNQYQSHTTISKTQQKVYIIAKVNQGTRDFRRSRDADFLN